MEYGTLFVTIAFGVFGIAVAYLYGKSIGTNEGLKKAKQEYHDGWLSAKRYYHDEPREDAEQERLHVEKINEQNQEYVERQRVDDLCLLYGVAYPSQLPKAVRDAARIDVQDTERFYSMTED